MVLGPRVRNCIGVCTCSFGEILIRDACFLLLDTPAPAARVNMGFPGGAARHRGHLASLEGAGSAVSDAQQRARCGISRIPRGRSAGLDPVHLLRVLSPRLTSLPCFPNCSFIRGSPRSDQDSHTRYALTPASGRSADQFRVAALPPFTPCAFVKLRLAAPEGVLKHT